MGFDVKFDNPATEGAIQALPARLGQLNATLVQVKTGLAPIADISTALKGLTDVLNQQFTQLIEVLQGPDAPVVTPGRFYFALLPVIGGDGMPTYNVPADLVDQEFNVQKAEGTDTEGNPLTTVLDPPETSDPAVASYVDDPNTPGKQLVHIGAPGVVMLSAKTKRADTQEVVDVAVANLVVGLGATGTITPGGFNLTNQTPVPETPENPPSASARKR